jgi:hypothetical protein
MGNAYYGGIYCDTRGQSVLSVAVCDRCNRKMSYTLLKSDPNFPGLMVCPDDLDQFDPWRLAAIQTENITLRHPRPDVSVAIPGKGGLITNAPNVANINQGPNMLGDGTGNSMTPATYGNTSSTPTPGDLEVT